MKRRRSLLLIGLACLLASGCAVPPKPGTVQLSAKSAVALRAMQSREFETADQNRILRAIVTTFQDLGYDVTKVEPSAGTVSGNKMTVLRITASVYPRGESRTTVRANAIVTMGAGGRAYQVDDPQFYQLRFFEPLSKTLFLTALQVEDDAQPKRAASGKAAKAPAAAKAGGGAAPKAR